jgi:hypothetical protein
MNLKCAFFLSLAGALLLLAPLQAQPAVSATDIINRARATVGTSEKLDGLVTLRFVGQLEPADNSVPEATILVVARKPCSQRLEIRVGDMVETTIVDGDEGCLVRTNLSAEASQVRPLSAEELARVRQTTRQFFSFYRPDFKNGEKVHYEGVTTHRGQRAHALRYVYPDGLETTRYFSVTEDHLISLISSNGVESVYVGERSVSGIKYPERIDYFEGERKLHSIHFHEIEVNKPLATGIFEIPGGSEK